jgi:hypothetical protein
LTTLDKNSLTGSGLNEFRVPKKLEQAIRGPGRKHQWPELTFRMFYHQSATVDAFVTALLLR